MRPRDFANTRAHDGCSLEVVDSFVAQQSVETFTALSNRTPSQVFSHMWRSRRSGLASRRRSREMTNCIVLR